MLQTLQKFLFNSVSLSDKDKNYYGTMECVIYRRISIGGCVLTISMKDSDGKSITIRKNGIPTYPSDDLYLPDEPPFDLGNRKIVTTIKDLIETHLLTINGFSKVNLSFDPVEVVDSFRMHNVEIMSNVGKQITDIECQIIKYFIQRNEFTLFERLILGYRNYGYRIEISYVNPVRENRDKDYLPGFSDQGNDATYSVTMSLAGFDKSKSVPVTRKAAMDKIYEHVKGYDPEYKRQQHVEREKKKKWHQKLSFEFRFNNFEERIGGFALIYPFHGDFLSGHTDWIGITIGNDDEYGYYLQFVLAGYHIYFKSMTLYKLIQKIFVKHRPKWEKGIQWNEFSPILRKWEKEYPFEHFLNSDWMIEFAVNRAKGLYMDREFNGGRKSGWGFRFNPLRNKFWKLI